jgi:hypothetical protein
MTWGGDRPTGWCALRRRPVHRPVRRRFLPAWLARRSRRRPAVSPASPGIRPPRLSPPAARPVGLSRKGERATCADGRFGVLKRRRSVSVGVVDGSDVDQGRAQCDALGGVLRGGAGVESGGVTDGAGTPVAIEGPVVEDCVGDEMGGGGVRAAGGAFGDTVSVFQVGLLDEGGGGELQRPGPGPGARRRVARRR